MQPSYADVEQFCALAHTNHRGAYRLSHTSGVLAVRLGNP
ncbi:MAG: hypothetical protein RL039_1985 [Pseudomonadota bacterium]|jgi:hypothetical protein